MASNYFLHVQGYKSMIKGTLVHHLSKHYGKTVRCRATNRTAKGSICTAKILPCVAARERLVGKETDGKGYFAERFANSARQSLCRASRSMPCVVFYAVRPNFAVRRVLCRAPELCRAPVLCRAHKSLPCASLCRALIFAVRPRPFLHGQASCSHTQ
jgi:hypothetical protein